MSARVASPNARPISRGLPRKEWILMHDTFGPRRWIGKPRAPCALAALACVVVVASGACAGDDAAHDVTPDVTTDVTTDSATATDAPSDAIDATTATDVLDTTPDVARDTDAPPEVDATLDSEPAPSDGEVSPPAEPSIDFTIADIPVVMNGSVPSLAPPLTWRLRANRAHLTLDVLVRPDSGPIDAVALACTADDVPHAVPPPAAASLARWRSRIDALTAFPDGARVVCEATATGPGGSARATVDFDAATLPPALDPFPAVDEWLVVLSRDASRLEVTDLGGGLASLRSVFVTGGNGVVDLDEPFLEMGIFSSLNADARAVVKDHLLAKIRKNVYEFYGLDDDGAPTPDGVPIRIWFEGDPGAPSATDFGGDRRFSMIALGGDGVLADQQQGTFGRALIDWNNQDVEDDTTQGLGVFPTALARQVLAQPLGAIALAGYRPAVGGTPFGDDPDDHHFLGRDLTGADMPPGSGEAAVRIEIYNLFIEFGALALSSILAHEIGHSLGLVPYGLPPEGLFAGVDVDWIVTLAPDAHIDTEGLNIMQTGGSVNWIEAVGGARPRFEPLSWAYLTRQLVVGP